MRRMSGALSALGLALLAGGGLTSAATAASTVNVQIVASGGSCTGQYCFVPTPAAATSGDTVAFTNTTTVPHTVTRCDSANCSGQGPGTGTDSFGSTSTIAPGGGTTSHQFSGGGTYFYYCQVHGYSVMHGEVDVAPPAQVPESPSPVMLAGLGLLMAASVIAFTRRHRGQVSAG